VEAQMRLLWKDTQTHKSKKKMGWWQGATFKEYICKELACYATGMSKVMKRKFNFVNIAGNAGTELNEDTLRIIKFEE
jgi:hypothetical protein